MTTRVVLGAECDTPYLNKFSVRGLWNESLIYYPYGVDDPRSVEFVGP